MKHFPALFILAFLFAACVSRTPAEKEAVPESSPEVKSAAAPERRVPEDGLDSLRFKDIPEEAKIYLKTLSDAFRKKDKEFLLSQGEIQYENELRFRHEEEVYLAMLYRAGPYSDEMPDKGLTPPRLKYDDVEEIEYTDWEEKGPVLNISGSLYLKDGTLVPCVVTLVWRLVEPKILGARPD